MMAKLLTKLKIDEKYLKIILEHLQAKYIFQTIHYFHFTIKPVKIGIPGQFKITHNSTYLTLPRPAAI